MPRTEAEAARVVRIVAPATQFAAAERFEANQGGAGSVRRRNDPQAFSLPQANLDFSKQAEFAVGNGLFERSWVTAPASTIASDGLGQTFNARSCQNCHVRDGRGHPPVNADDGALSLVVRLGQPGEVPADALERYLGAAPDPVYGHQFSDASTAGIAAEGRVSVARDAAQGGMEVSGGSLDLVTFLSRNLAVPRRADVSDPQVLRGKQVFDEARCTACHMPKLVNHRLADGPEDSFQLIWFYSDLMLHDMGPGLAEGLPAGQATGSEWRTSPLRGIGLTEQVSGHRTYLHDGRARSLTEAILWHGGEGQDARDAFAAFPPADRAALLAFLKSL